MTIRLRIAIGLLLGALVASLLIWWLADTTLAKGSKAQADRSAVVSLLAVTDAVSRAGAEGAQAQAVIGAWAGHQTLKRIRVANLENRSIEASTFAEDIANGAPPRRMVRDEKPFYDLGQLLRGNVEANEQEGGKREDEISIEWKSADTVLAAAPVVRDGAVVGFVQVEAMPHIPAEHFPLWPLVIAALVPALIVFGAGLGIGERKIPLLILAAIVLTASVVFTSRWATKALTSYGKTLSLRVADQIKGELPRVEAGIAAAKAVPMPAPEPTGGEPAPEEAVTPAPAVAPATPIDPSSWDTDLKRAPRGLIKVDVRTGKDLLIDDAKIAANLAAQREALQSAGYGALGASLLLMLFVGSGLASSIGAALKKHREAYYYVAPAMIGMLLLVFFPFFYGITLSFTDQNIYNVNKPITDIWIGLKNYSEILLKFDVWQKTAEGFIFNYKSFYWTLGITVLWTVVNVTIGVSLGLLLALILNTKGLRGKTVYRVLLILPWAVPNYITALIWRGMFHQQFGVVNQVIQMFGGTPVSWFNGTWTSFTAVCATNGWLSFPFMMVVSLGALQSISADLYEAARVDGASKWQQFTSITLPSLKPALVPAVILSVVWTFNMFNIIYLVSAGEPAGSTEILITQAYKIAFEQYRYGYAAAYSTVIFGILLIYGTWQNRVTRATEGI